MPEIPDTHLYYANVLLTPPLELIRSPKRGEVSHERRNKKNIRAKKHYLSLPPKMETDERERRFHHTKIAKGSNKGTQVKS